MPKFIIQYLRSSLFPLHFFLFSFALALPLTSTSCPLSSRRRRDLFRFHRKHQTLKQKYSPPSAKISKLAENITAMSLGTKLRHMRTQKNLSQMQVAQELDVSQTAYNKWESDQSKPGIDNLLKISQFYEMDVYELLNESAGDKIFNNNFYENASVVGRYSTHNHLSERLIEQYEARIKALEEQVAFWKEQARK